MGKARKPSQGSRIVAESCPTLRDPMDYSLPGSSVCGTFQARILEWVTISFSRVFSLPRVEPKSPALQADSLPAESSGKPTLSHAKPVRYKYTDLKCQTMNHKFF